MKTDTAICTILAANYIAFGRVMAASFKKYNPGIQVYILLVDKFTGQFDPDSENFKLVKIEDLPYAEIPAMLFDYDILEVCTAVKPFLMEYLINKYNLSKLAYLDPDILFTGGLDEVWQLLDKHSIVLTPHLTEPISLEDKFKPSELEIMRSGTYNLGFIAVAADDTVKSFLKWWQERLVKYCVREHNFLFVDQKWIDLIHGYYENIYVLRDPTYNVAYWNLMSRQVKIEGQSILVNGRPLKFFHFSGLEMENPNSVSKYQDRYMLKDLMHLIPLFEWYRRQVITCGYVQTKALPYGFGYFDNGVSISGPIRKLHLDLDDDQEFGDAFKTAGDKSFYSWLNTYVVRDGNSIPVSNLWDMVYKCRADVQAAFPDIYKSAGHRRAFLHWCIDSGVREHKIDSVFLQPVQRALESQTADGRTSPGGLYGFTVRLLIRIFGRNSRVIFRLGQLKQRLLMIVKPR